MDRQGAGDADVCGGGSGGCARTLDVRLGLGPPRVDSTWVGLCVFRTAVYSSIAKLFLV